LPTGLIWIKFSGAVITSTSDLLQGSGTFDSKFDVTNNGILTLGSDLIGNGTFINATGATLNLGGLVTIDDFDATQTSNTVKYFGVSQQDIRVGDNSEYYHLILDGAGDKDMVDDLYIKGDLTNYTQFNSSDKLLYLSGNWTNNGGFVPTAGQMILDGNSMQTLNSAIKQSFFDLVIDKSSGEVVLGNMVVVNNLLEMKQGDINTAGFTLTLGTDISNEGTLSYTTGYIIGTFERYVVSTTNYVFPLGEAGDSRLLDIKFNNIAGGKLTAKFIDSAILPLSPFIFI